MADSWSDFWDIVRVNSDMFVYPFVDAQKIGFPLAQKPTEGRTFSICHPLLWAADPRGVSVLLMWLGSLRWYSRHGRGHLMHEVKKNQKRICCPTSKWPVTKVQWEPSYAGWERKQEWHSCAKPFPVHKCRVYFWSSGLVCTTSLSNKMVGVDGLPNDDRDGQAFMALGCRMLISSKSFWPRGVQAEWSCQPRGKRFPINAVQKERKKCYLKTLVCILGLIFEKSYIFWYLMIEIKSFITNFQRLPILSHRNDYTLVSSIATVNHKIILYMALYLYVYVLYYDASSMTGSG